MKKDSIHPTLCWESWDSKFYNMKPAHYYIRKFGLNTIKESAYEGLYQVTPQELTWLAGLAHYDKYNHRWVYTWDLNDVNGRGDL